MVFVIFGILFSLCHGELPNEVFADQIGDFVGYLSRMAICCGGRWWWRRNFIVGHVASAVASAVVVGVLCVFLAMTQHGVLESESGRKFND